MIRYEDRMARGLASVINLLDPDVIVMGGGVSNIARLYREVPLRLGQYVFSDTVSTPIVPAATAIQAACAGRPGLATASLNTHRRNEPELE